MPDHSLFRLRILPWCIALAMSGSYSSVWAEDDIQNYRAFSNVEIILSIYHGVMLFSITIQEAQ